MISDSLATPHLAQSARGSSLGSSVRKPAHATIPLRGSGDATTPPCHTLRVRVRESSHHRARVDLAAWVARAREVRLLPERHVAARLAAVARHAQVDQARDLALREGLGLGLGLGLA